MPVPGRGPQAWCRGYPGSPLAGLDKLLAGIPALRVDHDVRLMPG